MNSEQMIERPYEG